MDLSRFTKLGNPGHGGKHREQVGSADEHQLLTALGRQRQKAGELDCVACPLFGMKEQGFVRNGLPIPLGMWTLKRRKLPGLPTPFVLGKPPPIVSQLQEGHAQIEVGLSIARVQLNGAFIILNGLLGLARRLQRLVGFFSKKLQITILRKRFAEGRLSCRDLPRVLFIRVEQGLGQAFAHVAALLPRGFGRYARLFHPARNQRGERVRWAEVAAWSGRTVHPLMAFERICAPARGYGATATKLPASAASPGDRCHSW